MINPFSIKSRTKNVSINAAVALITQFINLIISFISRTVFIKTLGAEYLGVNGLFANILTILSFAELGIGSAIVYNFYKPLAVNDREKIKSLMLLYKKAYRIIGMTIFTIGLILIPFLKYLIKSKLDIPENITLLYLLFLLNTSASYFLVYKKSILTADQKNYIVLFISEGVRLCQLIVSIVLLISTHNYLLYLITMVCFTVLGNIVCAKTADNLYPYLKEKAVSLRKAEVVSIFKDVRALALYKFCFVILNGTDNILVSSMIGTIEVGLVSNYVLLTGTCSSILGLIADSFTASVGNLNAIGDNNRKKEVFDKLFFITAWLFGFASVGLAVVSKSFITAWIGENYTLPFWVVLGLVADFYVRGVHFAAYTYRVTMGFFVQAKYSAVAAAVINIVLSIIFCKMIGLSGIFIATPISRILTTGMVDPIIIYKNVFHSNPIQYYIKYILFTALFIGIGWLCNYIISLFTLSGWIEVVINVIIVTIIFNTIMLAVFHRSTVFIGILQYAKSIIVRL